MKNEFKDYSTLDLVLEDQHLEQLLNYTNFKLISSEQQDYYLNHSELDEAIATLISDTNYALLNFREVVIKRRQELYKELFPRIGEEFEA